MKRVIQMLTLTDEIVLSKCNKYDYFVIYSSLIRQVLSFLFTFCVLLYGTSQLVAIWQAIIITFLMSAILFMIDQALIGSEWSMRRSYFNNKTINKLLGFILLNIRFIPRIVYSVIIAIGLATLAEISIQDGAISRILSKETKAANADYFSEKWKKEQQLDKEILDTKTKISNLKSDLAIKKEINQSTNKGIYSEYNAQLNEEYSAYASRLPIKERRIRHLESEVNALSIEKEYLEEKIKINKAEKRKEENDLLRGASCGTNCERFRLLIINSERKISTILPELNSKIRELEIAKKDLEVTKTEYEQITRDVEESNKKLSTIADLNTTVKSIKTTINSEEKKLTQLQNDKKGELDKLTLELKDAGFYEQANYGLLDKYIGLKKLHSDPNYGVAAKEFSLALKVIVVLLELSAVIVAVFFSPFSFYHERMRAKRDLHERIMTETDYRNAEYSNELVTLLQKTSENERKITELTRDIEIERQIRIDNSIKAV